MMPLMKHSFPILKPIFDYRKALSTESAELPLTIESPSALRNARFNDLGKCLRSLN